MVLIHDCNVNVDGSLDNLRVSWETPIRQEHLRRVIDCCKVAVTTYKLDYWDLGAFNELKILQPRWSLFVQISKDDAQPIVLVEASIVVAVVAHELLALRVELQIAVSRALIVALTI